MAEESRRLIVQGWGPECVWGLIRPDKEQNEKF